MNDTFIAIEIKNNTQDDWVEVRTYPLESLCVLLGRGKMSTNTDICIDSSVCSKDIFDKISSVHLTFFRRSRTEKENYKYQSVIGYSVKDGYLSKKSTNGSFLNGKPLIEKVNLKDRDIIQIGQHIRVVYYQQQEKGIATDFETTLTENPTSTKGNK